MAKRNFTDHDRLVISNLRREWDARKSSLRLTQESVTTMYSDWNQSTVSHYLNGTIRPNLKAVLRFAAVLQIEASVIDPLLTDQVTTTKKPDSSYRQGFADGWKAAMEYK